MNEELNALLNLIGYKEEIPNIKGYFENILKLPVDKVNKEKELVSFKDVENPEGNSLLFRFNIFTNEVYPEMTLLAINKKYLAEELPIPFDIFKSLKVLEIIDNCISNQMFEEVELEIGTQLASTEKEALFLNSLHKEAYEYNLDTVLTELQKAGLKNIKQEGSKIFVNDNSFNSWIEITKLDMSLKIHPRVKKYFSVDFEETYSRKLTRVQSKLKLKKYLNLFITIMGIVNNSMEELVHNTEGRELYRKLLKFIDKNLNNRDLYYKIKYIADENNTMVFYLNNQDSLIETILVLKAHKEFIEVLVKDFDAELIERFEFKYKEFKL